MSGTAVVEQTSGASRVGIAAEAEADASASAPAEVAAAGGTNATPEKGLWSYLGLAVSAVLLILVIALAAVAIVIPKLAGALPMTVLTSSMVPRFPPGTLIVVKPVNPDDLAIGDVATYQMVSGKPGVITHRIIAINLMASGGRTFEFMGDNNGVPDAEPVQEAQIQGKLWYSIPLIGWVNNLVNGANKVWIIPVLAGLLLSYAGYMVVSALAEANRARRVRRRIAKAGLANAGLANGSRANVTLAAEPGRSGGRNAQHDLPAGMPKLKHPMGLDAVGEVADMFNVRAYDA